jgi:hypothetical protein
MEHNAVSRPVTEEIKFAAARQMFVDHMAVKPYPNLPVQKKKDSEKEPGKGPA